MPPKQYQRARVDEFTSGPTVQRWFQTFRSGDESLKIEEGRDGLRSLDMKILQEVVEQIPSGSVRKTSQTLGASSTATVSQYLKSIGKVNKLDTWVPRELSNNRNLR